MAYESSEIWTKTVKYYMRQWKFKSVVNLFLNILKSWRNKKIIRFKNKVRQESKFSQSFWGKKKFYMHFFFLILTLKINEEKTQRIFLFFKFIKKLSKHFFFIFNLIFVGSYFYQNNVGKFNLNLLVRVFIFPLT